jgi:predicted nucleic acid-binding protein
MAVLLDTNVLLRIAQPHHPQANSAARALRALKSRNESLVITQQNIVEFWAVTTRPIAANGLSWTTAQVSAEITALRRLFAELPELPLQQTWERLVLRYGVAGKSVHDARLVAAMIVHGVQTVLTFNAPDFARYQEIAALDPVAVP